MNQDQKMRDFFFLFRLNSWSEIVVKWSYEWTKLWVKLVRFGSKLNQKKIRYLSNISTVMNALHWDFERSILMKNPEKVTRFYGRHANFFCMFYILWRILFPFFLSPLAKNFTKYVNEAKRGVKYKKKFKKSWKCGIFVGPISHLELTSPTKIRRKFSS